MKIETDKDDKNKERSNDDRDEEEKGEGRLYCTIENGGGVGRTLGDKTIKYYETMKRTIKSHIF